MAQQGGIILGVLQETGLVAIENIYAIRDAAKTHSAKYLPGRWCHKAEVVDDVYLKRQARAEDRYGVQ